MRQVRGQSLAVHIAQVDANLRPDFEHLSFPIIEAVLKTLNSVSDLDGTESIVDASCFKRCKPIQDIGAGTAHAPQSRTEGAHGGLHALEEVDPHQHGDSVRTM